MKIYNFRPDNGSLISESDADESPLENGVFLIPANATNVVPPSVPDGKYAAFYNSAWHLLDRVVVEPEVIAETTEQIIARYEAALDSKLDSVARMYRYDNRFTFALRAAYAGPWHDEAVTFATWMDTCNAQAYTLLQNVIAGNEEIPTIEVFIAGLPEFVYT